MSHSTDSATKGHVGLAAGGVGVFLAAPNMSVHQREMPPSLLLPHLVVESRRMETAASLQKSTEGVRARADFHCQPSAVRTWPSSGACLHPQTH